MTVALPVVALVGRPNVGKSSLFNRIVGVRHAIVADQPGTTRDRSYATIDWGGKTFLLVDTAGLTTRGMDELAEAAEEQARAAVIEAELLLVVADVLSGVTAPDETIASVARRSEKPSLLLVNKCDTRERGHQAPDFYRLGLGEPYSVSAQHGIGIADVLDEVVGLLPSIEDTAESTNSLPRVAIVGRPNVGKSSLLNWFAGQDRALVSSIPGTTRDAIDTRIHAQGHDIVLVDTAGLRRRGRVRPGVERYSVIRALKSVQRADVCLLMLDATEGATDQDAHIGGYIIDNSRGLVILANKWDLVQGDEYLIRNSDESTRFRFSFVAHAPVLRISTRTGLDMNQIIPAVLRVNEGMRFSITTGELNKFLNRWVGRRPPASRGGIPGHFRYATQVRICPPTFALFFSDVSRIQKNYVRYLENGLREEFGLQGVPVRLILRGKGGRGSR